MTQPIDYMTPDMTPPEFARRKTGLLVFGIILIIMGSIAGCFALLVPIGVYMGQRFAPQGASIPIWQAIVGGLLYAGISTALIWLGVGSVRARRWVRPLILILSALCIITGVFTMIGMILSLPMAQAAIQASQPASAPAPPRAAVAAGMVVGIGLIVLVLLVIPAVLLWYYKPAEMRLALEYYDPTPRWTDRCPIPVLAISVTCVLFALSSAVNLAMPVVAMFGILFVGIAAIFWQVAMIIALSAAALWTYQRRMIGWSLLVALIVILGISMILNALRVDPKELASVMGMSQQQLESMDLNPMANSPLMAAASSLIAIACIVYAIWVRRYFGV